MCVWYRFSRSHHKGSGQAHIQPAIYSNAWCETISFQFAYGNDMVVPLSESVKPVNKGVIVTVPTRFLLSH